jgi:hypothetical protein
LGAESQLVHRQVLARLINSLLQIVDGFHVGVVGGGSNRDEQSDQFKGRAWV